MLSELNEHIEICIRLIAEEKTKIETCESELKLAKKEKEELQELLEVLNIEKEVSN